MSKELDDSSQKDTSKQEAPERDTQKPGHPKLRAAAVGGAVAWSTFHGGQASAEQEVSKNAAEMPTAIVEARHKKEEMEDAGQSAQWVPGEYDAAPNAGPGVSDTTAPAGDKTTVKWESLGQTGTFEVPKKPAEWEDGD